MGIRSAALGYGADSTRQKFTGKERDDETGLDFFGARYFSSVQGRFTSTDPAAIKLKHVINPQDLNRYSYVANNPLAFIDPDGADKIRIIVSAFIPAKSVGGYKGDNRKVGEKIGAKDGFRIRQTIVVETDPHRNRGGIIVNSRSETGISVGPDFRPGAPMLGAPGVAKSSGDSLQMTAVRTDKPGGVSVNFQGNEQNPLAPFPGNEIFYNLNVTVQSVNERSDAIVTVDGEHTGFPGFDVVVERLEAENKNPAVVYGYDPGNSGSTPLRLLPGMPKERPTELETLRIVPAKRKKENGSND